jgi:hypothetical protein
VKIWGTIEVSDYHYLEGTPTINKPWVINAGLTWVPTQPRFEGKLGQKFAGIPGWGVELSTQVVMEFQAQTLHVMYEKNKQMS